MNKKGGVCWSFCCISLVAVTLEDASRNVLLLFGAPSWKNKKVT